MSRPNLKRRIKPETKWYVSRSYGRSFLVLLGLLMLIFWIIESSGISHYLHMTHELNQVKEEIIELEQVNKELIQTIELVEADPFMLEKLARERLGYVKEGETVYQLVE